MAKKIRAPHPQHKNPNNVYLKEVRTIPAKPQQSSFDGISKPSLIDGYKDPTKVFHKAVDKTVRQHIIRMRETFQLPEFVKSHVVKRLSSVLVVNHVGRKRELLPDVPPRHVMLCHGYMSRVITSGIGMFVKISNDSDGCWALVPESVVMINRTTVQHIRRRRLWFLRKYGYELSFDGHVEPCMMLFDYGINPEKDQQRFYVTLERVPIRDHPGKFNQYFRFWKDKKNIKK